MTPTPTPQKWSVPRPNSPPTLATYATFLVTYRAFLVLAVIGGLAAGALLHFLAPERYTSTAHMVIVATTVGDASERQEDVSIDSALQLIRSDQVIGYVARQIDYPGGPAGLGDDVTTRPIVNSRILRLSVASVDPNLAQLAVTAITNRFFEIRKAGLKSAALTRVERVDAELAVVEAELVARYRLATEDDLLSLDDATRENGTDATGIRDLVTRRAELHGERSFLDMSTPEPGYLSRPATEPLRGSRSGLAITVASVTTTSLLAAVGLAALHQTRPERFRRGQHRPLHLVGRNR